MESQKYPRLRTHKRVGKSGKVWQWWTYDNRGRGGKEIPLGSDYEQALAGWAECERGVLPKNYDALKKIPKVRKAGTRRNLESEIWDASPKWAKVMYFNAERRSAKTGRAFAITPAYFLKLIDATGGKCSLSGIGFEHTSRSPFAPSLDRIESDKGYEPGNVRLVCHVLNVAMNTWGLEPVLLLAHRLLQTRM